MATTNIFMSSFSKNRNNGSRNAPPQKKETPAVSLDVAITDTTD